MGNGERVREREPYVRGAHSHLGDVQSSHDGGGRPGPSQDSPAAPGGGDEWRHKEGEGARKVAVHHVRDFVVVRGRNRRAVTERPAFACGCGAALSHVATYPENGGQ